MAWNRQISADCGRNHSAEAKALRVAFFVGAFPVISETFILRQITGLLDEGHEVDIYADVRQETDGAVHAAVRERALLDRVTFMELPVETVPYEMPVWPLTGRTWPPGSGEPVANWRRLSHIFPKVLECFVERPALTLSVLRPSQYGFRARSLSSFWRLARLMERGKAPRYDVLHAHFGPTGESFRFARALWGAPLIVTFHGYDFCTVPRKEGADVYHRLFETADAVTVNSEYTGTRVAALGCPRVKIHQLPMGLPVGSIPFHPRVCRPGEPLRLLTVARLVAIKGHAYVLHALARGRDRLGSVEYHIVGDGPERDGLRQLADALGLGEVVYFHGACDERALLRHYGENHLFILPSVSMDGDAEGQGLALQEAQAAGMPVVATRHGALPEGMREGVSGVVVPERDVAAMAEALIQLRTRSEDWAAMGQAGRAFVSERFDSDHLRLRLIELYRQAVAGYSQHSSN